MAVEDVAITVTRGGYLKRTSVDTYRRQTRGGKGRIGMGTRAEDVVEHLIVASTHSYLLIFTTRGRVYWLKAYEIPDATTTGKGKHISNLINLQPDETVKAFLAVKDFVPDQFIVMVTQHGVIKKSELTEFDNPMSRGIIAVSLDEGDELIGAKITNGGNYIFLGSHQGQAIRFAESQVRAMGRTARGVRAMHLPEGDFLVGMEVVDKEGLILSIAENGFGKRTKLEAYRLTARGGKGVINMKTTNKTGKVVAVLSVNEDSDLMIVSQNGKIIRIEAATIRQVGRSSQGVRLVSLEDGDKVAAASVIPDTENGNGPTQESLPCSRLRMGQVPSEPLLNAMPAPVELTSPARLREKEEQLFAILRGMGRMLVAFSGGTDSAYLAWAAHRARGRRGARHYGRFRFHSRIAQARRRSLRRAIRHRPRVHRDARVRQPGLRAQRSRPLLPLQGRAVHAPGTSGPPARLCAHHLRRERGRPGRLPAGPGRRPTAPGGRPAGRCRPDQGRYPRAVAAGGLPTWDRPASACLSSRIPYGTPVTIQTIKTVETGEEQIKALGFRQFRVRFHGEVVRIEIARDEMERALTLEMAQRFTAIFKAPGLQLRDAGPGGLPPGLPQRSAEPEEVESGRYRISHLQLPTPPGLVLWIDHEARSSGSCCRSRSVVL